MNNLVSVIIPCYNGEKFIDQSIESVYIQDYAPIELIVVDDESTDRSAERIKFWQQHFTEKGNTLKYIYQKNRGLGGAIDTGLKHVTGTYLTLLDVDDVYLPGAIEKKARFLDENPDYSGVRNNGWRVSGFERRLFITDPEEKKISDLFAALSFGRTNNWAGTYMVRTDILFEAYPDRCINPSRYGQNFQILLPVAYKRKFGFIDEPLMEYRIQPESHSQNRDQELQYKKTLINAAGWRDIYVNVLEQLIKDPNEYSHYYDAYHSSYHRALMYQAIWNQKNEDLRTNYLALKQTGFITIEDRITYAKAAHSPMELPLRVLHKLSSIFRKGKV